MLCAGLCSTRSCFLSHLLDEKHLCVLGGAHIRRPEWGRVSDTHQLPLPVQTASVSSRLRDRSFSVCTSQAFFFFFFYRNVMGLKVTTTAEASAVHRRARMLHSSTKHRCRCLSESVADTPNVLIRTAHGWRFVALVGG